MVWGCGLFIVCRRPDEAWGVRYDIRQSYRLIQVHLFHLCNWRSLHERKHRRGVGVERGEDTSGHNLFRPESCREPTQAPTEMAELDRRSDKLSVRSLDFSTPMSWKHDFPLLIAVIC